MKISLVVTAYNEQFYFSEVMDKYLGDLNGCGHDYEVVLVNDGCTDQTGQYMNTLAQSNKKIKVIALDKRYGKQAGITVGMAYTTGDVVVLADIDSTNPVGILNKVIAEYDAGNKIVYAYKEDKKGKSAPDYLYEKAVGFFAKFYKLNGVYTPQPNIAAYDRNVVDVINEIPEKNKLLRVMDNWVEWEIKQISYPVSITKEQFKKIKKEKAQKAKAEGNLTKRSKVRE
ncbi:MAG: glycosyltransferase, partial [Firmicutes bacterium]|nr:glycosyltransferase [Bacillota bacterium]